jgi:hypothetical protein
MGVSLRYKWASILAALLLAGCSSGELTLTEYASEVEDMVAEKASRLDVLGTNLASQPPGLERTRAYWQGRAEAGAALLEQLDNLDPPGQITDLHTTTRGIMARYVAAEGAYAERAKTAGSIEELEASAEARAVGEVEGEIIALCRAAQAQLDATADREAFTDLPWIPPELQEVVQVAFRCASGESVTTP